MGKRSELLVTFRATGGPFVVTRYDANKMRSVRRGKKVYDNLDDALRDAIRYDRPNQPPLMVDLASAVPASPHSHS